MQRASAHTRMLSWVFVALGLFFGTDPLAGPAFATEGGGGAYPNGAEDFMTGALPPAGTYFLDYATYYGASSFKDNSGDNLFPKFDLAVMVNAIRIVHVTRYKILGADWGVHAFLPLAHMDVDATTGRDDRSGMGDIIVDPIILGWHSRNLHVTTGLDFYIPVGNYDEDRLTNTGRNCWTVEPVAALTYLWDNGFELSGKFMYDFNWENPDTEYRSGQEFHFDYTLGYHVEKNLAVGAGGYYYYQTTDDELDGHKVGTDGFKGRVAAIGPQAAYN
ncbi:hypothetical protein EG829_10580, partial [bacterium]|nr:hypothetical protein [bacterium]